MEETTAARSRIAFEELFVYSAAMLTLRGTRTAHSVEPMRDLNPEPFFASLAFSPTGAQRRVIGEICRDLASGQVMSRMVQGDVGSGKTLIAAAASYLAAKNGFQTALMAPTEILAEQHIRTFETLFAPFGLRVGLLTGAMSASDKALTEKRLLNGEIDLLIGTHALFQAGVAFQRLGLVITDEQHRFGVAQRAALSAKGKNVHTLVMSATPIPRTLSLILYGDLDLSVVDELPAGRQPVATYCIDSAKRARAMGFIRRHLDAGQQAYIVCPLVEESDGAVDLRSAVAYKDELADGEFAGYRVGLLHGRMKPKDKDDVMRRFAAGEIQLLVATTVIEVGVDVPNATIMLIENAERFGLSQLHQLRGRVGRGCSESSCILVSDAKGEIAKQRLSVIKSTTDGFRIAEEDLRLRGPGELLGLRQSGLPNVDLVSDPALLALAQETAAAVLHDDPLLSQPSHSSLRQQVEFLTGTIGELPN
jgi:ATP-dependent DNA helicase RecG